MSKQREKIPCTVCVLTRNNEKTLSEALESVRDFAEIVICDGGSTDKTLEIARQHRAVIIDQAKEYKDQNGRLCDYSGVRNQMLLAASNDWQFHLDSDEIMTPELVAELKAVVLGSQQSYIYLVPRKYVYNKKVIDCSVNYPSHQYRFFNRRHVTGFTKRVHERIRFAETEQVQKLRCHQLVPLAMTSQEQWKKFVKYIAMEASLYRDISFSQRIGLSLLFFRRLLLLGIRLLTRRVLCTGAKLPIAYEFNQFRYQFVLCKKILTGTNNM